MSFFPELLYINPFNGELTETPIDNLTEGMSIVSYKLSKIMGYKAYYHNRSTKLLVVAKGNKYTAIG